MGRGSEEQELQQQPLQAATELRSPAPTPEKRCGEHVPPTVIRKEGKIQQETINVSKEFKISIENTADNFRAGKTADKIQIWETITSDQWIINTIRGCTLELTNIPIQTKIPKPLKFSAEETDKIATELKRFLACGIIECVSESTDNEFISNIFIRPKKDGRVRVILNLKHFNSLYVDKSHFKMESLRTAINSMRPNCYMASVDLSDAYYSIKVKEQDRKYFRFIFQGVKYQFTALVMGYSASPRLWTKLMKPVFAYLRSLGHVSVYFIDDSWLFGATFQSCIENVQDTVQLMDRLGLTISQSKSVFIPCTKIVFLGFILCSVSMTVRLTPEKCQDIIELCKEMKKIKRTTIRIFAKLIGKLVAAGPGVEHAPLFTKPLEKIKENQLRIHRGNFDSFMNIPHCIEETLNWWIDNLPQCYKKVSLGTPDVIIYTDASLKQYGAYDQTNDLKTMGFWSTEEQSLHINILELKACEIGLLTFCKQISHAHVRLYTDNTTSCAYINKYGGKVQALDDIARRIWKFCIAKNISLSAFHVPGITNKTADRLSRTGNDDLEWSLDQTVFEKIQTKYPEMHTDLFASKLNAKLASYVSRHPEPNAIAVDAFSLTWNNKALYYIFPPFSLICRILQKLEEDKATTILVAPIWPTQVWWPNLIQMIKGNCYLLPKANILHLVHKPEQKHPLTKMRLAVFYISGKHCECREFRETLKRSSSTPGEVARANSTTLILRDGFITAKGRLIPLTPLYKQ